MCISTEITNNNYLFGRKDDRATLVSLLFAKSDLPNPDKTFQLCRPPEDDSLDSASCGTFIPFASVIASGPGLRAVGIGTGR